MLFTLFNVFLMLLGFGLVIVVHELGHFIAARWAGVRVHAFAVGFGPAIFSWRKGLGFRRGSSEREFLRLTQDPKPKTQVPSHAPSPEPQALSPTEYRLNWIPFGGYVKMLGQEDLNPGAGADLSPDSFAAKPVWKRMIIISGGVVMNLILAAVLFVIAYSHGLREIMPIVGWVEPGSPAAAAGLRPGDQILAAGGKEVVTFGDLSLASAMSRRQTPLTLVVHRPGMQNPLEVAPVPVPPPSGGLLQIGVGPAPSNRLLAAGNSATEQQAFARAVAPFGLAGVEPGMELIEVDGRAISGVGPPADPEERSRDALALGLYRAFEQSAGRPVRAVFRAPDGRTVERAAVPEPVFQAARVRLDRGETRLRHILGLAPVLAVAAVQAGSGAERAGLRAGDIFAQVGNQAWPTVAQGIAAVRRHTGSWVDLVVWRDGAMVSLRGRVDSAGRLGFTIDDSAWDSSVVASSIPESVPGLTTVSMAASPANQEPKALPTPASRLFPAIVPGSRITSVAGRITDSLYDVRAALLEATADAARGGVACAVELELVLPPPAGDSAPPERLRLELTAQEARELHALGWDADAALALFEPAQFLDRAAGPADALAKGVRKTHYVVMMTYATFARMVEGTVPVDQIHGPVGITHVGARVAERGFIYLLFFLGLISANLAVVNFLPIPIADGGLMVFLIIEALTRRPVSVGVQNFAAAVGLVLVGAIFLFVTFNDIMRLLG